MEVWQLKKILESVDGTTEIIFESRKRDEVANEHFHLDEVVVQTVTDQYPDILILTSIEPDEENDPNEASYMVANHTPSYTFEEVFAHLDKTLPDWISIDEVFPHLDKTLPGWR